MRCSLRFTVAAFCLLVLAAGVASAESNSEVVRISVRTTADLRGPNPEGLRLFDTGAGGTLSAAFPMPFYRPFAIGAELGYHFVPVPGNWAADPFSISLATASLLLELRYVFFSFLDVSAAITSGYVFGIIHDDQTTGHGFVSTAGVSAAYMVTPWLSVGALFRMFQALGIDGHAEVGLELTAKL